MLTEIAIGLLGLAVFAIVKDVRREQRPLSRRIEPISDEALDIILALFPKREYENTWKCRRLDWKFVHDITVALENRSLTAAQIKKLFNYTYAPYADEELKRYFGMDEALRDATEKAEEDAKIPKPVPPPKPKLPLISDADFKAFTDEMFSGTVGEVSGIIDRYPFSFTRVQQATLLAKIQDTREDGKVVDDRSGCRATLREKMQIHEIEATTPKHVGVAKKESPDAP